MVNLQWYNYKLARVILKHHKVHWHILYFAFPILIYMFAYTYFEVYFYVIYLPSFLVWYLRLDRKLKLTGRVKRAFSIYALLLVGGDTICYFGGIEFYPVLLPLIFVYVITTLLEKSLLKKYHDLAQEKLYSMKNLRVIAVTASFGKTSIKNFITHILSAKFNVYSTPRSVNTFTGIVLDINTALPKSTEFYVVEAGAREKGDIKVIAELLRHQYAVIGKVGAAHIEYFKTLKAIRETKLELLESSRLVKVYLQKDLDVDTEVFQEKFPDGVVEKRADLDGIAFLMKLQDEYVEFEAPVLGRFNIDNVAVAIKLAFDMGMDVKTIKKQVATIKPVEHRLQKIVANGKIILDDSFNGNIDGMLEAIRLAGLHQGRKVIVTPGLVESNEEHNRELAEAIDKVFDVAIITGSLNSKVLSMHINHTQKVILKEKSNMEEVLKAYTMQGDLLLFANDAPNFI